MKAVNAAERQRWLVALGSSKACLTDTRTKKEKGNSPYTENIFLHKYKEIYFVMFTYSNLSQRNNQKCRLTYIDIYHSKKNCKQYEGLNFREWISKSYSASTGWYVTTHAVKYSQGILRLRGNAQD